MPAKKKRNDTKFFDENVKILSAWAMRETKNEVILACVFFLFVDLHSTKFE